MLEGPKAPMASGRTLMQPMPAVGFGPHVSGVSPTSLGLHRAPRWWLPGLVVVPAPPP